MLTSNPSVRVFFLTLFALVAIVVLAFGWQDGVPWTAAAFVAFFVSRVWRSVIKRPLTGGQPADPLAHANRFILVTAGGYLASGLFACIAAAAGEGEEWLYVAPFALAMGALNLYVARLKPSRSS